MPTRSRSHVEVIREIEAQEVTLHKRLGENEVNSVVPSYCNCRHHLNRTFLRSDRLPCFDERLGHHGVDWKLI